MRGAVACERCYGDGVITVTGHSVNPASGFRVVDPQEADDVPCPDCGGSGELDWRAELEQTGREIDRLRERFDALLAHGCMAGRR